MNALPHRRQNALTGQWVIVSPHRLNRPWKGQVEKSNSQSIPSRDPLNPLCPGSTRPNGIINPEYESTFCFDNDFSALLTESTTNDSETHPLFQSAPAAGACKVMCFHPRSDLQLATMSHAEIRTVIDSWCNEFKKLAPKYDWVQIFENKGAIMGCSNPHPHCQIWCCQYLPQEPSLKDQYQRSYYDKYKVPLLMDYVAQELERKERIVVENDHWLVVVPYWAVWPYETMVLPKRHIQRLDDVNEDEKSSMAEITKSLLVKYDNLFECLFPYSMGFHGAPTGKFLDVDNSHWTFHAVYLPPLLRSATVRKFMAGFELVCEPQRDLTPESAAETLRNLPSLHYTLKN